MANYTLSINSTFQPFSYQELVAPVAHQQQVMDALSEQYDKLSAQADVLEAMGENDRDRNSGVYSRYKSYSNSLRKEADELYRFGLNSESRRRLSDLRRRYNTDIVPIQNAWNKREEEAKMQMTASLQNPSLMFTRDARSTSLDEYVNNPTGGYGVINGANIAAQMGAMAKNLEKQVRSGYRQNIDDYTYRYIEQHGLDANMIRDWRNNPTLSAMFEQVMRANGVTPEALQGSLNMDDIIRKSTGHAEMGMWNALGEDKSYMVEDFGARKALEYANARNLADYNAQLEVAKAQAEAEKEASNIPNWAEEHYGIKTKDGYVTNAAEVMGALKTGHDALKASYFGKKINQVNPMAIYEDYQRELKKHTKEVDNPYRNPFSPVPTTGKIKVPDEEAAKKATLEKYSKYGVKDILSKDQYNILKSLGYDNKSTFGTRYSDIEKGLNEMAVQYTRYSTKMTGYDLPDQTIRTNILRLDDNKFKSGMMWDMNEDGSIGKPVSSKDKLNLKSSTNNEGVQVEDIQYDPQHKTKLLVTFSDGSRKIMSPDLIDAQLTKAIRYWENSGFDPRIITSSIGQWLNTYNKQQGKTGNS